LRFTELRILFLFSWQKKCRLTAQNYEKYPFLCTKTGQTTVFFSKKVIFFGFLFVY